MSYSDYQYPPSNSGYESYSQQYDTLPYSSSDLQGQFAQYDYTSSHSLDQYAQPAASVPTDYTVYSSTTDTGYTSAPTPYTSAPTPYTPAPTAGYSDYIPYQYSQDSAKADQFTARSSGLSENTSGSFTTSIPHYTSGTTTHDQGSSLSVSDYSSYQYQPPDYSQVSNSYGQESTTVASYAGSYDQSSSAYTYQEEPSQPSSTWASTDQYTSYSARYEESTSATSYNQKDGTGFENTDYSPSVDTYSQASSSGGGYSQPVDIYSAVDDHKSYQSYVNKSNITQVLKPQQDFVSYSSPSQFNRGSDSSDRGGGSSYSSDRGSSYSSNRDSSYSSTRGNSISVKSSYSPSYYSGGRGRGSSRGDFRGGYKNNYNSKGDNSFSGGQDRTFSTPKVNTQGSFNQSSAGSSVSVRGFSNRGSRDSSFSARGSFTSSNRGDRHNTVDKSSLGTFDARNKINEARSGGTAASKVITHLPPSSKNRLPVTSYKPPEKKKEVFKAPSRPQDRLLNEIEEKEKAQRAEELKKSEEERKKAEEERKKAEEKRLKALEEEKKQAEEELRKKVAEDAVKAAPPSKAPETAEEIAHEEEIQRKIRESLVIINPEKEIALMKNDPSQDIEMSEELRKLLKTLTTDYLCKLCSVRIVGSHMAAMHYNGKNHTKKLRNFVQTNGRSAGFNMETLDKSEKDVQKEVKAGEKKAEIVEITDIDEKSYCKICKVSFSQESQAEMHYKGKNHAKKLKSIGSGTGPELFECKICSVTVTAQEHLTAHLNGSRHKLQVRKLDTNENYRGGPRGRGRGVGFRGRGRGASRGRGNVNDEGWRPLPDTGTRGRGFKVRGSTGGDFPWRGRGFKRRGGYDDGVHNRDAYDGGLLQRYGDGLPNRYGDGLPNRSDFGPSFVKRPRF